MQVPGAFPEDASLGVNHPLWQGPVDTPAELSVATLAVGPAQSRGLAMPEILALIGHNLDRVSLARALVVCRLWHTTLLPVLWSSLHVNGDNPRYASSAHLDEWLDLLEPHVHFTRSLSLYQQLKVDQDDGNNDDDDDDDHLSPLQITARILSLRHATNIQAISLQTSSPIHTILLSAQRLVSLERLVIQALGGPPILYLSDAFYAYPRLRHLCFSPFAPNNRGSQIVTTPALHPSKYLHLQSLELHNVSWPARDLLTFTACCPHLEHLAISGRAKVPWDWTVETIHTLVTEHCPKLKVIHLHPRFGTELAEPLLVHLLQVLPLAQLRKLSVPNCNFGLAAYELLLMRIEHLTSLNVSYTRMPGIFPWQLTALLSKAYNLRHLEAIGICIEPPLLDPSTIDQHCWRLQQPISSSPPHSFSIAASPNKRVTWACKYLTTLKIGFGFLGGGPAIARSIYAHLAQFEYLEHLCITPSHVPIRLGQDGGLEQLATLKRLRVFDSHGTKGDMKDKQVITWMAEHWPCLATLQVFLEDDGHGNGGSTEAQREHCRQQVVRWFEEHGRYVQVIAA